MTHRVYFRVTDTLIWYARPDHSRRGGFEFPDGGDGDGWVLDKAQADAAAHHVLTAYGYPTHRLRVESREAP